MVKINRIEEPARTKAVREKYLPMLLAAIQANNTKAKDKALENYNQTKTKDALILMQNDKCAFCEIPNLTNSQYGDIEHFQPKVHYPELAFNWDNFFLSCVVCNQSLKHDFNVGSSYPFEVVKPDVDDPNEFFEFVVSSDINPILGSYDFSIKPKEGISDSKRKIAEQTIELFELNSIKRKRARFNALKSEYFVVQMAKANSSENLPAAAKAPYQAIQQPTQGYSAWLR